MWIFNRKLKILQQRIIWNFLKSYIKIELFEVFIRIIKNTEFLKIVMQQLLKARKKYIQKRFHKNFPRERMKECLT